MIQWVSLALVCLNLFGYSQTLQITSPLLHNLQVLNTNIQDSFLRVQERPAGCRESAEVVDEIRCPPGFRLDEKELVCYTERKRPLPSSVQLVACSQYGQNPNPENCRTFINCGDGGMGWIMECPSYLLFDQPSSTCQRPLDTECCEYFEKNPDRLVQ